MPETSRITLTAALDAFLGDCRAAGLSPHTIRFYLDKLPRFIDVLASRDVTHAQDLSADCLRGFFAELQTRHTPGGVDAYWRAVSAFMGFLERDGIIVGNPLRRLRRPKVDTPLLPPIPAPVVRALFRACQGTALIDRRDTAILHILLDTGLRAGELLRLNVGDIDFETGSIHVRTAKSRKARVVFISARTRRLVRAYLRKRETDASGPLLLTMTPEPHRLTYDGLRSVIEARARKAEVEPPPLHAFRRTFAITAWRNGVDLVTLTRLMGHGSLPVLMRYIAAETSDLATIHERHGNNRE